LVAVVLVAQEATLQQEKELTVLIQYFHLSLLQVVEVVALLLLQAIVVVLVAVMALKHQEAVVQALLIKDLLVEVLLIQMDRKVVVEVVQVRLEPMAQI
jgi:hypothetical protein